MNQIKVCNYKTYTNEQKGLRSVFKYSWAFHPYQKGECFLKISLELSPVSHPEFNSDTVPTDFEALERVLLKLRQKYNGMLFEENLQAIGFAFSNYDLLCEFINTASATMRVNGVVADPVISRYSAFPSHEFANEMLQHIFDAPVTLYNLEKHMKSCAMLEIAEYDEQVFGDFPLVSDYKFDPSKDTDMSFYEDLLQDKIDNNQDRLAKVNANLKDLPNIGVLAPQNNVMTQTLGEEATLTQGFWI